MSKLISLTQGKVAIVDDADYERVVAYRWYAQKNRDTWYAVRNVPGKPRRGFMHMHRFILDASPGVKVDHHNGDGLDNSRSNLRVATNAQNLQNRGAQRSNTSGYKGVVKRGERWLAQIKKNQRYYCAGTFNDPVEAAKAYDRKALELHGEFAQLNFPQGV